MSFIDSLDRILVFSGLSLCRGSLDPALGAIVRLGRDNDIAVDTTTDLNWFNDSILKEYKTIIFLGTDINTLNIDARTAFQRFIQAGGGTVVLHASVANEYTWPWFNELCGVYFASHSLQDTIKVIGNDHSTIDSIGRQMIVTDQYYQFDTISQTANIVAWMCSSGSQVFLEKQPYVWYNDFDGGRACYFSGGHYGSVYLDGFKDYLLAGIRYTMGKSGTLDYSKIKAKRIPEENRFSKTVLSEDLNEPMELAIAPDGRIFFTERNGSIYEYDPESNKTKLLHRIAVQAVDKYYNGLIGITLDPGFLRNNFIYLFHTTRTGQHYYHVISRFTIRDKEIDPLSEKIIMKIPIDLESSAHTGGSLDWDSNGNLYISTGDNTIPSASNGYAPLDERPGRQVYDAQRGASNTNDLRGKILRIHPEEDGSYTIPEGNLFKNGMPETRPEIYVMGCRNPYRISVDRSNDILYWGEVGPDAGINSRSGPKGFDEINQARQAGNFGWPYFVADNLAYSDFNFSSQIIGPAFDANAPVNNSPNNSGRIKIPPAQKPMIWYPYERSGEFGLLGQGGRCAMSGPVYHYPTTNRSDSALPEYYDNALFVYDWMRNAVFTVHLDDNFEYSFMEPFLYSSGDFRRPIDMEIGRDGTLYMLEYGSVYGIDNADARLVRISYNRGNRKPVASIAISDSCGAAPLCVELNGVRSSDQDNDSLAYEWSVNGKVIATGCYAQYNFSAVGIYKVVLTVADPLQLHSSDMVSVVVGNTKPVVKIATVSNSSFYFETDGYFDYKVSVIDKEDKQIDPLRVSTTLQYNSDGQSNSSKGHQKVSVPQEDEGEKLIDASDCKACHQLNARSAGPSFFEISRRYDHDKKAVPYLSRKIITGGAGEWGDHPMSAHPQLTRQQTIQMVRYILSLGGVKKKNILPSSGRILLDKHSMASGSGKYILTASYTDEGNGILPLRAQDQIVLRAAKLRPNETDTTYRMERNEEGHHQFYDGSAFMIKNMDFKHLAHIKVKYALYMPESILTIHSDNKQGPVLASIRLKNTGSPSAFAIASIKLKSMEKSKDVYFVFHGRQKYSDPVGMVDWVFFEPKPARVIHKNHHQ